MLLCLNKYALKFSLDSRYANLFEFVCGNIQSCDLVVDSYGVVKRKTDETA